MESKSLMGLNLSIDNELIASAVQESIVGAIAASMGNKDLIINEFVKSILTERVLEDGREPRGYSREKTISKLEFYVRKAITEELKEQLAIMVNEFRPKIRESFRTEFAKKSVQNNLVNAFIDSIIKSVDERWYTTIEFDIHKRKDE